MAPAVATSFDFRDAISTLGTSLKTAFAIGLFRCHRGPHDGLGNSLNTDVSIKTLRIIEGAKAHTTFIMGTMVINDCLL